jgi:hypothetical protein
MSLFTVEVNDSAGRPKWRPGGSLEKRKQRRNGCDRRQRTAPRRPQAAGVQAHFPGCAGGANRSIGSHKNMRYSAN